MDPYRAPTSKRPSVVPRESWEIPANDGHLLLIALLIGAACLALLTAARLLGACFR